MTESNYQFVQEDLRSTVGSQGTLLIPRKIFATLVPEVTKTLLPRELAALYFGPADIPGSSIDVNTETPRVMTVRRTAEGAELPLEQPEYATTNMLPLKYSLRINITKEMEEDSQFPLLQRAAAMAGRRFAENETRLILTALDGATNVVSGGSAITLANIARAMQYLEDNDFAASDLIVGPEVVNDLRLIDTLFEANKSGGNAVTNSAWVGSIYGMQVWRFPSTASIGTTTRAYVIDRRFSYMIAEKRAVSMEEYNLPTHDTRGVALTQRIVVSTLRDTASCRITTT